MRARLSRKIFHDIRNDIILKVYPIGARIPTERELAGKYRTSRLVVREAITMLAQNSFVEAFPPRGTFVKDFVNDGSLDTLVQTIRIRRAIDKQTLDSLFRFRFIAETDAASEAALCIAAQDLIFLTNNLKRRKAHLSDIPILTQCDYEFHYKIITVSNNIISKLVFQSLKPIYTFITEIFFFRPAAPETSLALNLNLVDALKQKDQRASAEAMAEVLKYGKNKIYEAIDERELLNFIRQPKAR